MTNARLGSWPGGRYARAGPPTRGALNLKYRKEFPTQDELVVVAQGGWRERNRQLI